MRAAGVLSFIFAATTFFLPVQFLNAQEIFKSSENGNLAEVRSLLEKNSDLLNSKDETGRTPLHRACRGKHADIIEYLINRGANVNLQDNYGCIPLHNSAVRGHMEAVRLLVSGGAEINLQDKTLSTPLHWAARRGHENVVVFLLEKQAKVDIKNEYGRTPLHLVARISGNVQIGRMLISSGADINMKCTAGWPPLNYAVFRGRTEIVSLLIEKGVNIPYKGKDGEELLHRAAMGGQRELLDIILSKGGDTKSYNKNGGTLLHSAAAGGLENLANDLLKKGFDINSGNRYGFTPLHRAAEEGKTNTVKILLAKGAFVNAKEYTNRTPLLLAHDSQHKETADFIRSKGGSSKQEKYLSVSGEYLGCSPPGRKPVLLAPGIISSPVLEHSAPSFSPEGKQILWSMFKTNPYRMALMYMQIRDGKWTVPEEIGFTDGKGGDFPLFSNDGKTFYFISSRPVNSNVQSSKSNFWYAVKTEKGWSEPELFDDVVNERALEWGFSFARNGDLYFTSTGEGSLGSSDIYVSRNINGRYQLPENAGESINTLYMDSQPFIAPDGRYLIFNSTGRKNDVIGGGDLYISFRLQDGSWSKAGNMGRNVNSEGSEFGAKVSPDGKYLFFVSDRNGNGDIYWMDAGIIDELKPEILK